MMTLKLVFTLVICLLIQQKALGESEEKWTFTERHPFSVLQSLFRSQSVTTDNQGRFWFSSWNSIIRTDFQTGGAKHINIMAIPQVLSSLGSNHIGDITYAAGKIFAPIEDESKYLHPCIGVYDAETLKLEKYFELPSALQKDGVPWVTVNEELRHVYSSEYSLADKINVYDMNTLRPIGFVHLSQTLHSVQGAKVHKGFLYVTANGVPAGFSIYRINLESGQVAVVAEFPAELIEVEGLSFINENGQEKIVALGVIPLIKKSVGIIRKLHQMVLYTFVPQF